MVGLSRKVSVKVSFYRNKINRDIFLFLSLFPKLDFIALDSNTYLELSENLLQATGNFLCMSFVF